MPCYEVNTYDIEFKAENRPMLLQAVKDLQWGIVQDNAAGIVVVAKSGRSITLANGRATATASAARDVNSLRVAYSRAIVNNARQWAQQSGWTTQQTAPNSFLVIAPKRG